MMILPTDELLRKHASAASKSLTPCIEPLLTLTPCAVRDNIRTVDTFWRLEQPEKVDREDPTVYIRADCRGVSILEPRVRTPNP